MENDILAVERTRDGCLGVGTRLGLSKTHLLPRTSLSFNISDPIYIRSIFPLSIANV